MSNDQPFRIQNSHIVGGTVTAPRAAVAKLSVGRSLQWNASTDTYTTTNSGVTRVHENMKRCVVNDAGKVVYYLDPTNSANKADGTAANLDGSDGNVMVEIPRFYFRQTYTGNTRGWEISDVPLAGFALHPAFFKNGEIVDFRYIGAYNACLKFERSITAVADAGGGDITVTTSVQHPLYAGDTVTISGTTSYDGEYTVVSRASTTTFTVTAAFVATETGTASGYVSGKNLDDMTANIDGSADELASVSGQYPLVGVTRPQCRSLAVNVGTGWRVQDFWLTCAVQMLYLVEYGDFNSQANLGDGNTNGSYLTSSDAQTDSPHTIAGASNAWGNGSTDDSQPSAGARPGTAYMSYRGIENFFGNCWNWVDGVNIGSGVQGDWHVSNDDTVFADNTTTDYDFLVNSMPSDGYATDIADVSGAFIPSATGGSSSTYLADYFYDDNGNTNRVAFFGGSAIHGAIAGAFCWRLNDSSSNASRNMGGRLSF